MATPHLDALLKEFHDKMPAAPKGTHGKKATWLLVAASMAAIPTSSADG
jgi:hypothetical protein